MMSLLPGTANIPAKVHHNNIRELLIRRIYLQQGLSRARRLTGPTAGGPDSRCIPSRTAAPGLSRLAWALRPRRLWGSMGLQVA